MTSTTKSETVLPDPTEEEKQASAQQTALIQAQLDMAGYMSETTEEQVYANPERVNTLKSTIDSLTQQKADLERQISQTGMTSQNAGNRQRLQAQYQQVTSQITTASTDLAKEQESMTTKYDTKITKKEDERVAAMRAKGDNAGADALKIKLDKEHLDTLDAQDDLYQNFLSAAQKAVAGDFSITPQQKQQISDFASMYRDPIMKTIDGITQQISKTQVDTNTSLEAQAAQIKSNDEVVQKAFGKLSDQIKETGLSAEDALLESHNRAVQNGVDMNTALDQSIAASRSLAEQGLFDTTKELRLANARLSGSLGRASTDPAMVERLNSQLLDATKSVQLNLASQAATGKLQVSQKTADALQSIADYKVQLRQTTGSKLEGVAAAQVEQAQGMGNQLLGVKQAQTENVSGSGLRREQVAQLRAGVESNTQQLASGLRLQAAQPLTAMNAGQSAMGTIQGMNSLPFGQLGSVQQQTAQQVGQMSGLRAAQPTTTQTSQGSILSGIFSAIGVGASAVGAAGKAGVFS